MSSTVKIVLGVAIALIVVCCGGCGLLGYFGLNQFRQVTEGAKEAGDETMNSVFRTWDGTAMWQRGATEMKSSRSEADVKATMAKFQAILGPYSTGGSSVSGIEAHTDNTKGSTVEVTYTNDGKYEKGSAKVTMRLVRRGGANWQVARFEVEPTSGLGGSPEAP